MEIQTLKEKKKKRKNLPVYKYWNLFHMLMKPPLLFETLFLTLDTAQKHVKKNKTKQTTQRQGVDLPNKLFWLRLLIDFDSQKISLTFPGKQKKTKKKIKKEWN